MIIEVGNIKSRIRTDNPDLIKALKEVYSFRIKGAEYTPGYRRGAWDGKKSFITSAGVFRSGLLSRILEDLRRLDCTPEIKSEDESSLLEVDDTIDKYNLRDYQKTLANEALKNRRGIIDSPTGSGKTIIMASIVKQLEGKKVVILFNTKQLVTQTYEFLKDCGIDNLGICFGGNFIYGDIMCCTVQSIDKILDTHLEDSHALLVDECHEFCKGKTTVPAIQAFESAKYRLGFTGTVPKDPIDLYTLEGAFGPAIKAVSTKDLIDDGKLDKPIIQIIDNDPSSISDGLSYQEVYEDFVVNSSQRNNTIKNIVESIKYSKEDARILILVERLEHSENLKKLIPDAYFLAGDDDINLRYRIINMFVNDPKPSVLIGTRILQTGVNIEEISHFINARGLKSEISTIQALGRSLRRNRKTVYVYDFKDNGVKWLSTHANKRIAAYKLEGHTVKIL
tara:strand:+ start:1389 stop:2741 length:1353 start_codon:yes stop_codon:yes gene_type:complete